MKTDSGLEDGEDRLCGVTTDERVGKAQDLDKHGDESHALPGPLVSVHVSSVRLERRGANLSAVAHETADALAGKIEQPVMAPTRSSFLAKWKPAPGATGYRLDISTTPSFDSYVATYHARDIGNTTSHVVSGLDRGTRYYYRAMRS